MLSMKVIKAAILDIPTLLRPKDARVCPNLFQAIDGMDPADRSVKVHYSYLNPGLNRKPFIIEFGDLLKIFGGIDADAINTYTVGQPVKRNGKWKSEFYNTESMLKESWFGAYVIFDDENGLGRNLMLNNPKGSVSDIENISGKAMKKLIETDQKVVFWLSHDGDSSYTFESLEKEFYFTQVGNEEDTVETDSKGREWKAISAQFASLSATTDPEKAGMRLLKSFRGYCGLPSKEDAARVSPWGKTEIQVQLYCQYVKGKSGKGFWVSTYSCGQKFKLKDGTEVNTYTEELQQLHKTMFREMDIDAL